MLSCQHAAARCATWNLALRRQGTLHGWVGSREREEVEASRGRPTSALPRFGVSVGSRTVSVAARDACADTEEREAGRLVVRPASAAETKAYRFPAKKQHVVARPRSSQSARAASPTSPTPSSPRPIATAFSKPLTARQSVSSVPSSPTPKAASSSFSSSPTNPPVLHQDPRNDKEERPRKKTGGVVVVGAKELGGGTVGRPKSAGALGTASLLFDP